MTAYLQVSVFVAGFGVMAAEMVAPRLLAPVFGTSQLVWTNVIGTILVALTVGAWLGGRLADRVPTERAYALVLAIGGLSLAAVPLASRPLLLAAAQALAEQRAVGVLLSLGVTSLCFAPPVLLLAMATPWAIRLGGLGRTDLGRVAGRLGALAALGSIAGTFASSLVLLPLVGSRTTLVLSGGLVAATGALRSGRIVWTGGALLLLAAGVASRGPIREESDQVYEAESLYNYVQVRRDPAGRTLLLLNESLSYQSVDPGNGVLTGGVWDYLSLVPALSSEPGRELRVLVVGLAGGTVPRQIAAAYGSDRPIHIHGIELDPMVIEIARRYFDLDTIPGLEVSTGDARAVLATLEGRFHTIVIDVFRGIYIPPHLATREFFEEVSQHLEAGGVVAINVATSPSSEVLLGALATTLEEVFPHVRKSVLPSGGLPLTSVVVMASHSELGPLRETSVPPALATLRLGFEPVRVAGKERRVLTDDRAPVELLTDLSLLEAIR